jgi:signal transduction histidine kinase
MNIPRFFDRVFPSLVIAFFLAGAGLGFTVKYTELYTINWFPGDAGAGSIAGYLLFCVNFYIVFTLYALSLAGSLFVTGVYIRSLCITLSFINAVIVGYMLNDTFIVKLCVYGAYVTMLAFVFPFPRNMGFIVFSILAFSLFLLYPGILGPVQGRLAPSPADLAGVVTLAVYLSSFAVSMVSIRFLRDRYRDSAATAAHLNIVSTKLLLFNHRLQEYVKNQGEDAVKKDRLRFTSDLHDSCGYVFTNIIAISDAAISCGYMEIDKLQGIFQVIRNQAREGLHRTRETLHMIRSLQYPISGSIDTVYQMKSIFEEVTGIRVEIESGNMRHDYGAAVNTTLTRIVQEAFTNSIRHGKATRIVIQFWEFPGNLTMIVSDNGVGSRHIVRGIGFAGMEERLAALGGVMEVSSPEDGGFRLKVDIPLLRIGLGADGREKTGT